jgi:transposase
MSAKERERLKIFERVKRGELQQKEAAALCQLEYRYLRRLYKRYVAQGDRGLVHQGRGRPSNRAYAAEFKAAVLARYQERYPDFGPTLAAEKLALDGQVVDHETLRGWLLKAGLWQKRRKRGKHRSWRERRAHFGELVQLDGSHHKWFEERAPKACLMNMVDDAQSTTLSWLAEEETIFAAMQLLWHWIERYGIPQSLYTDKKNVYVIDEKTREKAADSGEESSPNLGVPAGNWGLRSSPRIRQRRKVEWNATTAFIRIGWSRSCAWRSSTPSRAPISFCKMVIATNSMKGSRWRRARRLTFIVPPKAMTWPVSFVSRKNELYHLIGWCGSKISIINCSPCIKIKRRRARCGCDAILMVSCTSVMASVIWLTRSYPSDQNEKL